MALKKSDLYSSLWASCDELRGGMDASQYKDYVLTLLFIKYVSDKYADSDDFAPSVVIPKGASFKDMVALKGNAEIGDRINKQIIAPLVAANEGRLGRNDFPDFNDPLKLGEGKALVDRLTNLVGIFENPVLDFSHNRAENDDILGDAYEYLMRHFATESGKSKGQFYTPAEVSRVIAQAIGIGPDNTTAKTTAYDPTCGSGSLLLKVAAQAGKPITLEGQEKDVTTAGLARMNMILHDFPTARIRSGNTLSDPKFKDGEALRTFDYVVANPPFSDKTWSTGLIPEHDAYQRFSWGVPPKKKGDYAYLLHILRSMKGNAKGACVMPHGVLFRGNAEAEIRQRLIQSGCLKAIIGLPANLFYGTGIPACILVLDKENAAGRKGIYMIDASRGFIKDGPKNRLREQDIRRIMDVYRAQANVPHYARMVPFEEIQDARNDWNLNLPRYIDTTEPEDLQDVDAHLNGGIPKRDVDALGNYWQVLPDVRAALFEPLRSGYARPKVKDADIKATILGHPEFGAFKAKVDRRFQRWVAANRPQLEAFDRDDHPRELIERIASALLDTFRTVPLLDAYDVYQHLMDYWNQTLQDDAYLIAADGWRVGAQPREIRKAKDKNGKLAWPEAHDYEIGKRRYKSDLIPAPLLIARYFKEEQRTIDDLEAGLAAVAQQLDEQREEQGGEDGLLAEAFNGESDEDREKNTQALMKTRLSNGKGRLKEIGSDPEFADEANALRGYNKLLGQETDLKKAIKAARQALDAALHAKYPKLSETEIKTLSIDDKWLAMLAGAIHAEVDRVSQALAGRIRQLAERYGTPLPKLAADVDALAARVAGHLHKMGATWA